MFARPERDVVAEQLHYCRAVLVVFLVDVVDIGDGILEGAIGQFDRPLVLVQNLVVEDADVEVQPQPNRVRRGEVITGQVVCLLVAASGTFYALAVVAELAQVTIVVSLHLQVEHFRFDGFHVWKQMLVDKLKDAPAIALQLLFNRLSVTAYARQHLFISGLHVLS